MKKFILRLSALLIVLTLVMSTAACSGDLFSKSKSNRKHRTEEDDDKDKKDKKNKKDKKDKEDKEDKEEKDEEDGDEDVIDDILPPDDPDAIRFPDEEYSYSKVHPNKASGTVSGQEAKDLLKELENKIIVYSLTNYADIVLLFDDYEQFGIEIDEIGWGEVEPSSYDDLVFYKGILEDLYTVDYESLDRNDKIFYDRFLYDMEESAYYAAYNGFDYMTPVFNSFTSQQCDLFFILDVVPIETLEEAENYIKLLEDIDRYYDDLCAFEEKRVSNGYACSDDSYEGIAVSFDNLVAQKEDCFLYDSFENRLLGVEGLSDSDRTRLISEHEDVMKNIVFPEFEECAQRMRALKGSATEDAPLAGYENGEELYRAIVRSKSNSDITLEEAINQMESGFYQAIFNPLSGFGSLHDYSVGSVSENLDYLYGEIFEYFPSIPDHEYTLRDVPEVFADSFSPAAYLGYKLDRYDSNVILINTAASRADFGTVVAHEGYPGHMYQSIYTRSICSEHPYMFLFESTGYAEGWAQYVEIFSVNFFSDDPNDVVTFGTETISNIYLMAIVDLYANGFGYNCDEIADAINDLMGFTVTSGILIKQVYDICVADPGYPLTYALGYYNTSKTFDELFAEYPEAEEIDIITAYLNAQTGTYEQINIYAREELDEKFN